MNVYLPCAFACDEVDLAVLLTALAVVESPAVRPELTHIIIDDNAAKKAAAFLGLVATGP